MREYAKATFANDSLNIGMDKNRDAQPENAAMLLSLAIL